jgi:hypothetical protein
MGEHITEDGKPMRGEAGRWLHGDREKHKFVLETHFTRNSGSLHVASVDMSDFKSPIWVLRPVHQHVPRLGVTAQELVVMKVFRV